MALDPYSLCPGGRGKKIRFCCSDMVKEIEQIDRLLESNQGGACLAFIETLEKEHKDCACLTAAKLSVYRAENRWDDALKLAKTFLEKEPTNPVAASEYALALAVMGHDPKQAVSVLIDAFERSEEGTFHSSLVSATLQVGACLLIQGYCLPVIAIGNQLKRFPSTQDSANALLFRASSMIEFPILLRDMMFEHRCPENFPGKTEFEDAVELIGLMRWKEALAKLESLTQYASSWAPIWQNVAAVRFWLLENEKGCEALQTFAGLSNTPFEDAVDAEATRFFLMPDAMGDQTELLHLEYSISDAEKAHEKLLSKPEFHLIPLNLPPNPDSPPPKAGFMLLNRPFPAKDAGTTLDNAASQVATVLLFGKETDKEARLTVLELLADDKPAIEQLLKETLDDLLGATPTVTPQQKVSKSQAKIQYRFRYTPETYPSVEELEKLEVDYYDKVFSEYWRHLPLGLLDNKTPEEAASDPAYKIRILAAIRVMECWVREDIAHEFSNKLRASLKLPTLETIVIPAGTDEELLDLLDDHPVWRWYRFEVEKLPTNFLCEGIQIVAAMKELRASKQFATELLNRQMNEVPIQIRVLAFETLIAIAKESHYPETALDWIEKAKNEAAECNLSDAGWYLHEIPIRLGIGEFEKANEVINYLLKNHSQNEKVMQALHNLFVQLGFINPDGTPSAALARTMQTSGSVPEQPSSGLWTPGAETPAAGTGSKLWTPD